VAYDGISGAKGDGTPLANRQDRRQRRVEYPVGDSRFGRRASFVRFRSSSRRDPSRGTPNSSTFSNGIVLLWRVPGSSPPIILVLVLCGPCRIMVLSAVDVCRRMMVSEALAS
jgi:hypothetical protein